MASAPFDISSESLLSVKAANLTTAKLDDHTRVAEHLLGFDEADFASDKLAECRIALTLQVNFQLEQGVEAGVYVDMRDGETWSTYQTRTTDPRALQMAQNLLAGATNTGQYSPVTSLR